MSLIRIINIINIDSRHRHHLSLRGRLTWLFVPDLPPNIGEIASFRSWINKLSPSKASHSLYFCFSLNIWFIIPSESFHCAHSSPLLLLLFWYHLRTPPFSLFFSVSKSVSNPCLLLFPSPTLSLLCPCPFRVVSVSVDIKGNPTGYKTGPSRSVVVFWSITGTSCQCEHSMYNVRVPEYIHF